MTIPRHVCNSLPLPGRCHSEDRDPEIGHDALSDFDAYVALAAMIIGYTHLEVIPDDASTSPSEMASDDTQVRR